MSENGPSDKQVYHADEIRWAAVLYSRKGGTIGVWTGVWVGVFAWNHDNESVAALQSLQSRVCKVGNTAWWLHDRSNEDPGTSYNKLLNYFNHTLLDIPKEFDLPALIDANDAIVYDCSNKPISSKAHPLISGKPIVRPSEGKVSDMGRWLSQAHKYTNGPEGETGGSSGLSFL